MHLPIHLQSYHIQGVEDILSALKEALVYQKQKSWTFYILNKKKSIQKTQLTQLSFIKRRI